MKLRATNARHESIDEGGMKIRNGIEQNPAWVYVTYGLDLD